MMATAASTLPVGSEWTYEVKWDGYRAQAVKRGATLRLSSRNLENLTSQFPTVARAVQGLRGDVVLDGEIVALDRDGRPSFQALHHVDLAGVSVVYYAFDLLHWNGRDWLREPLDARRKALRAAAEMQPLARARCPFSNLPSSRSSHWGEGVTAKEMQELRWVKPQLVAEVSFTIVRIFRGARESASPAAYRSSRASRCRSLCRR
jgi:ATP-dependent DNA ligase